MPVTGRVVDDPDQERAEGCEGVAHGLYEPGQLRGHGRMAGAGGDEGDGGREGETRSAKHQGPQPRHRGRRDEEAGVPEGEQHAEGDHPGVQPAAAGDDGGHQQRARDADAREQRLQETGGGRRQAGVAVDLRQPAELDVGVHRLDAEQERQRHGGAGVDHPAAGGRPVDVVLARAATHTQDQPQPQRHGHHHQDAPRGQPRLPAVGGCRDRCGEERAEGAAEHQPGSIDRHQGDGVSLRLDPRRDKHIAQAHARQRHDGQHEEERLAVGDDAQQQARRCGHQSEGDGRRHADPAGEADRQRSTQSEAQAR